MEHWQNIISEALKDVLPGSESHLKMIPRGRDQVLSSASDPDMKPSSVLVLVYSDGTELFVCLIKRQSFLKNHAGQIGFPGGRTEKKDISLTDTALREASEETGIDRDQILILGALSPLYVAVSHFIIYPFVAWYPGVPVFTPDHGEVEKIILLPLLDFLNKPEIREVSMETMSGWLKVPAFLYDGEIIWGATAMILSEFFDVIRKKMDRAL